jgi:PAS domain S-box-containing protein
MGSATIYVSRGMQKTEVLRGLEKTAQQAALGISSHLDKAVTVLDAFAGIQHLMDLDQGSLDTVLNRFLIQQRGFINELILVDGQGKERSRVSTFRIYRPSEFMDRSDSPAFRSGLKGQSYVGSIFMSAQSNVPVSTVAVPIHLTGSRTGGVLLAEVTLREMWSIVSEIEFGKTGYVYVVDQKGGLIAFKELSEIYNLFGRDMTYIPEVKRFMSGVGWGVNQDHQYLGLRGKQVIGSYVAVGKSGWGVVVELPVQEAFAGIQSMMVSLAALLVLAILVTSILNPVLIRRITADLEKLRQGAKLIGEGNLDHRIDIKREDELGMLAQVFNSMTAQLRNMVDHLQQRVAERERAEAALRGSEEKYRNLVESTVDWVWTSDLDGRNTFSNEAIRQLLGYTPCEVIGKETCDLMHPEDRQNNKRWFQSAIEQNRGWRGWISRWLHRDGSVHFFESTAEPIFDAQGQLIGFTGIDRDISERRRAQSILQESEERFRRISDLSPFGISIIESDGTYLYANKKFIEMFGYTLKDIPNGKTWLRKAFPNPSYRREVIVWLSDLREAGQYEERTREYIVRCKDGTLRNILFTVMTMGDGREFVIYEDLTERKKLEEEMLKIQKLESVGILAGGIAHDFNNLLTGIIGNISLAKMKIDSSHEARRYLEEAEKVSARTKDLTQQLLTFSRGGAPVRKKASLQGIIVDSCEFVLRGSNKRCEFDLPENLRLVEVDEGQISQVISNIVINAEQAMPGGGVIKVKAENCLVDSVPELPLAPGRYVKISIKDEGIGIWKDNLPKIFDPYFTTKEKGSGLGLATVYSILKKHDGHITVESEPGSGTTFHIFIPALHECTVPAPEVVKSAAVTGKGRILVLDDEEVVQQVAGEMLEHLGYEVQFAGDGLKALEMYEKAKQSSKSFDVVLMDLTIPGGMGGEEAIRHLLRIDPHVKAVVSSGYSNDPIMAAYARHGFRGVVSKPYRIEDLSEVLYNIMNEHN